MRTAEIRKMIEKAGAKIRLKLDAKRHIRSPSRVGGTNDDADAMSACTTHLGTASSPESLGTSVSHPVRCSTSSQPVLALVPVRR